ncbi:hypothetical protein [Nocardia sp. NPDC005825]|uniref:hypothetical protein n=1 Tax=unclassified Nocardia TaxID=2637762 RepID=UPI0033E848EF
MEAGVLVSIAVVLAAIAVGYNMIRSQFYVGVDAGKVVVLRGSPGTVLGFTIREVDGAACVTRSGELTVLDSGRGFPAGCAELTRSDLTASARASVDGGLPPGNRGEAMQALQALVKSGLLPPCDSAASPGSTPPVAPPTTTTVPAPTLGAPAATTAPVTTGQNCRSTN